MTAIIGAAISLRGIYHEDCMYPFNLKAGIVAADIGKAVAVDLDATNGVKLAGDGDRIIGKLETVENRAIEGVLVGTVSLKGGMELPVKSGETVIVGDIAVGSSTAGQVKALAVADVVASTAVAISASTVPTDDTAAAVKVSVDAVITDANTKINAAIDAVEASVNSRKTAIVAALLSRNVVVATRSGFATVILY